MFGNQISTKQVIAGKISCYFILYFLLLLFFDFFLIDKCSIDSFHFFLNEGMIPYTHKTWYDTNEKNSKQNREKEENLCNLYFIGLGWM